MESPSADQDLKRDRGDDGEYTPAATGAGPDACTRRPQSRASQTTSLAEVPGGYLFVEPDRAGERLYVYALVRLVSQAVVSGTVEHNG